jgi:tryptophan 2,3-dioxygenase
MELKNYATEEWCDSLRRLRENSQGNGLSLKMQLDGLLRARHVTYWDYIRQDTLLSLQAPRTVVPDEMIFIVYHQISELYFRLILWEMEQLIADGTTVTISLFVNKIERINRYYEQLVSSFSIMVDGMNHQQFMQFRSALAPASGFQSLQYRLIDLHATALPHLVATAHRPQLTGYESLEKLYRRIYWKEGAIDNATGRKDLSLSEFEEKYDGLLLSKAACLEHKSLWSVYRRLESTCEMTNHGRAVLREFDVLANVKWPLVHLKAAMKHLQQANRPVVSTGGTNWRKYLPPRYQQISYFPELWTADERDNWGRTYTHELMNNLVEA